MGTRNLTCAVVDGEFKVAQYGQWDGYPEGQGRTICEFLRSDAFDLDTFKMRLRNLTEWTDAEVQDAYVAAGQDRNENWISKDVANRIDAQHPELSRDTGAEILQRVYDGRVHKVRLETDFAGNGLLCEWVYVLDCDREVLEVYKGFNQTKAMGRFAEYPTLHPRYSPVTLVGEIPFADVSVAGIKQLSHGPAE